MALEAAEKKAATVRAGAPRAYREVEATRILVRSTPHPNTQTLRKTKLRHKGGVLHYRIFHNRGINPNSNHTPHEILYQSKRPLTLLLSSFWTSRGHRCRPFSPPALAFNFYRA